MLTHVSVYSKEGWYCISFTSPGTGKALPKEVTPLQDKVGQHCFFLQQLWESPSSSPEGLLEMALLIPNFIVSIFTARSNNRASDWERQQEGSAGKADIRKAFLLSSVRTVIAKSQLRQIWVKQRKKKGGFLWKERKSQKAEARRITLFLNTFRFAATSSSSHCSPSIWLLTTPVPGSQPETPLEGEGKGKKRKDKRKRKKKKNPKLYQEDKKNFFLRKLQVCFPQNLKKIQSKTHSEWLSNMIFTKNEGKCAIWSIFSFFFFFFPRMSAHSPKETLFSLLTNLNYYCSNLGVLLNMHFLWLIRELHGII